MRFKKLRAAALGLAVGAAMLGPSTTPAKAITVSGYGNYCSVSYAGGGWKFGWYTNSSDSCTAVIGSDSGATIARAGLFSASGVNNIVARCNSSQSYVIMYQGTGTSPLSAAYNRAVADKQKYCTFTAAPKALPVFDSPFSLSATYTPNTGFDFARPGYPNLNTKDFGDVPGNTSANKMNSKGVDKSYRSYDNHDGWDWNMARGNTIKAVGDGKVIMARSWDSGVTTSDSRYQNEVFVLHTVYGPNARYFEQFVSYYAHLRSISVKTGDTVKRGQLLGYSGHTGSSSAPHLHFNIFRMTNSASARFTAPQFFTDSRHSNLAPFATEPYGFYAPKGFDPWAWRAYPRGALSIRVWNANQAPAVGDWG